MIVQQLYTGCLAEAAYYIESEGEAAIIDPLRETAPYIKMAERNGAKIKYIFETHFHADFVSGHVDLAQKTGATIVYGPNAETGFKSYTAFDGEIFSLGKIKLKVLHTPGHTLESSCYLLFDETGKESALFTGDTLFIGDVGRPDLAVKSDLTTQDLAGMLYDSLHTKILPLPDDLILYPAHGAGSACGKNMSKETTDTLGNQKHTNYALKPQHKETFIQNVTADILPAPLYFAQNALMNKKGYENIDEIMHRGLHALSPEEFETTANQYRALILDTRQAAVFAEGFIPNAINIGLDGQFAPWAGALIPDLQQPILLVTDPGKEEESLTRLSRVGYDHVLGYLQGGYKAWAAAKKETDHIENISPEKFLAIHPQPSNILDVRKGSEYETGHLANSSNLPLDYLNDWIHDLDKHKTYFVHCAGGYRSMITCSILQSRGFEHIVNIEGGYSALAKAKE
ncbi:MAG TPA: MBL fold metallo-hydrolase [Cytophagaceae bacterium]|nr:MBL fold metallo-hydrolase [Cytophagaceae bacterium]